MHYRNLLLICALALAAVTLFPLPTRMEAN